MKRGIFSPPALACAFTAFMLAALMLGPFMRETDQGWLLDGGLDIANGHPEIARAEFNFDKQFVSYCLTAALFKCFPRPLDADALVLAANIFGMLLFWGAMFWLLARSARRLPLALALPVILVPTFLVYSPFYASAFVSAAFVILLAAFLDREKWRARDHAVVFALAFAATGARADAAFLLPLLAMLHSPRRAFVSVLKSPNTWLMASAALAAFFLGRALYREHIIDFWKIPFELKFYLGYVAVGFGGGALLLLVSLHAVWRARRANLCGLWLLFLWLGLALPMTYYSFQLATPRHCTAGAVSVLVFICARRGRVIFQNYFRRKFFAAVVKFILLAGALLPLLAGADLTDLRHPRLTCMRPTLIPAVSGVAPVGALLGFALEARRSHGFVDQNQPVWTAAKSTRYTPADDGKVPYLFTPIESYLIFAMRLQGQTPERFSPGANPWPPAQFYVESRSLMRFQFVFPPKKTSMDNFFATTALAPATDADWHGITIFHGDTNAPVAPDSPSPRLWVLNTLFGPDEFRLEPVAALQKIPAAWAGKKIILVSRDDFSVGEEFVRQKKTVASAVFGHWQACEIKPLRGGETVPLSCASPEKVFAAVGTFPEWMSLQKP